MKILIDARMYGLENAGIGRYVINLVAELEKIDKENQYFILLRKNYFESLNLSSNWQKVLADFKHYTFAEQLNLPLILKANKADIVHFPHFNVPIFWKGKFVVTIHDMTMHKQGIDATKLPLPIYYFKRMPYLYAFKYAIEKSLKILVPSATVKDEICRYFGIDEGKVSITYEGVDMDGRRLSGDEGEVEILSKYNLVNDNYIFYVGNAYPHKNLKVVIAAIVKYNDSHKDKINFVIAGSRDEFVKTIEGQANLLNASKYIKILGYVKDNYLPVIYKKSLAFIYPSLSEGFGLQGLEAIAFKTVLLASDIPVFKEIYQDNAIYFDPNNPDTIVSAIENVSKLSLTDRENIIDEGRLFIKKYTWSKMAEETLNIYKSLK